MAGAMGSHQSTRAEETRWLTPLPVVHSLGTFDLDPCGAPNWPTADRIYLLENGDDGLRDPWHGRVWLNPPYSSAAWVWLSKLAEHGRGTALVFARTETAGFVSEVWGKATAVRFLHGRLYFRRPDGTKAPGNAGAPSVLVAYGEEDALALETSDIAGTYLRLDN